MTEWRLLVDTPRNAEENMAVDEAILEFHTAGRVPPTLRFYGWRPPAVSLGYFQSARDVDHDARRRLGAGFVRRRTGGRAVLHDDELTYSVAVRHDLAILPPTLLGSYRAIAEALIGGLGDLGVAAAMALPGAAYGQSRPGKNQSPACFDAPSFYEITAGGRKLIGSAQFRTAEALLQHGSLLLTFDPGTAASLLRFDDPAERERCAAVLARRATSLTELLGRRPEPETVAKAVAAAFARELGVRFAYCPGLLPEEAALAERLAREKYGSDDWNFLR